MICGLGLSAVGPDLLLRVPTEFIDLSDEVARSKPVDLFGLGETVNPNVLAGALLLPIPLLLALAVRTSWLKQRWLPPFLLLVLLPMAAALILAQSRGSYLALLLAVIVVITLRWPWAGVAMGISLITTVIVLSFDGIGLLLSTLGSDGSVGSFSGRVEIWQGSLLALQDYALTGAGLDQFLPVVTPTYLGEQWQDRIPHAHNLLLQIGMDLGVPGIIIYAWLWIAAIRILVRIIQNDGYQEEVNPIEARHTMQRHSRSTHGTAQADNKIDNQSRSSRRRQRILARRRASLRWALAVGTLGALVGMFIHGLVDAVTWGTKLAFYPWLFYALISLLVIDNEN